MFLPFSQVVRSPIDSKRRDHFFFLGLLPGDERGDCPFLGERLFSPLRWESFSSIHSTVLFSAFHVRRSRQVGSGGLRSLRLIKFFSFNWCLTKTNVSLSSTFST